MSSIAHKLISFNKVLWPLTIGLIVFFAIMTGEMGIGGGIVFGAIAILISRWFFKKLESKAFPEKANHESDTAKSDEDITHLYNEFSSGKFPLISNPPVNLKAGEVAHHVCPVEVRQLKTETKTYRGYGGTKIKIGKIPLFLGGSVPQTVSREVLTSLGTGNFVITNKRVVLSGTKVNYSIKLDQINDLKLFKEGIQIMNEGAYGG